MRREDFIPTRFRDCYCLTLYAPELHKAICVQEGSGSQLLPEDFEAGYNDYIDYAISDRILCGDKVFEEGDGGIYMYNNEKVDNWQDVVYSTVCEAFDVEEVEIIVIGGREGGQ